MSQNNYKQMDEEKEISEFCIREYIIRNIIRTYSFYDGRKYRYTFNVLNSKTEEFTNVSTCHNNINELKKFLRRNLNSFDFDNEN